jgi:methionine aminotransferase
MEQANKPMAFTGTLNHVHPTIFTEMSALARETGAYNLSQGFPDFPVEPELLDRVNHYLRKGMNQYAPMAGTPQLRQAIVNFSEALYGASYDAEREITITAGGAQAISAAIATSIREGDEVLLFSPAYDCYIPMIELAGGTPITVKLAHPHYRVDWDQVKRVVNHRTRMIVINTPHNPSGSLWDEEDYRQLAEIVGNSNILLLGDEVYEHLVYPGQRHLSLRHFPELRKRSFVVGSLGKTLHVTGWKIGYCMAPENLMKEFQKVHQYQVFCVNHPMQRALADHLEALDFGSIGALYQRKQRYFEQLLAHTPFKPLPVSGGYFQLAEYGHLSQEPDRAFAERLAREYQVATIPLSPFYRDPTDHHVLRFCFAKDDATLEAAVDQLKKVKATPQ